MLQNLILRKYKIAFQLSNQYSTQWSSDELRTLINALINKTKDNLFNLIANAYSSISIHEFSNLLNVSNDEAVNVGIRNGWSLDESKAYLLPVKQGTYILSDMISLLYVISRISFSILIYNYYLDKEKLKPIPSHVQMKQLTNIVSFLETS